MNLMEFTKNYALNDYIIFTTLSNN